MCMDNSKKSPERNGHNQTDKVFTATTTTRQMKMIETTPEVSSLHKPEVPSINIHCTYRSILLTIVIVLSCATRLYKVGLPEKICWDETHYGKMISWYINRTFFFDVHPPLGKLTIGLVGHLTGYNGSYPWKSPGDRIEPEWNTYGMRFYCALLGAALAPLAFETVYALSGSLRAASLGSACILFDIGTNALTRYLFLDSPLLFFIMATVWTFVASWKYEDEEKSVKWWLWSVAAGICLTGSFTVKFVGLFVIMWVGMVTITRLLHYWSSASGTSLETFVKQLLSRAVCLIAVPLFFYILIYFIHFKVLYRSGGGDPHYSSEFQAGLIGNPLNNASMPGDVAYGAKISLKSTIGSGAYLHSHGFPYPKHMNPGGVPCQQITAFGFMDANNYWMFRPFPNPEAITEQDEIRLVRNGDLLLLTHIGTKKNLHSHPFNAPVTKYHYQAGAYDSVDENDIWQIEVQHGQPNQPINPITTRFRLVHNATKCALESLRQDLPDWAFGQYEVTCNPLGKSSDYDNQLFNIEHNHYDRLPNVTREIKYGFWKSFFEAHRVMTRGNRGFKSKKGDDGVSRAWHWPINYSGQGFSGGDFTVYLLGNPILFWGILVGFLLYGVLEVVSGVKRLRGGKESEEFGRLMNVVLPGCRWMFLGWAVHYLPFFTMTRVLYFHHYFPANLFSCMMMGILVQGWTDFVYTSYRKRMTTKILCEGTLAVLFLALIVSFYFFQVLVYGINTGPFGVFPVQALQRIRWLQKWNFM